MISGERDKVLSRFVNMVWDFQRIIARQQSNPDNEVAFQADPYKKIDPETANAIIEETNCPNIPMHNISTSVNSLPIYFQKELYR